MQLDFTDYLMFEPSGTGTIYDFVPVANFSWNVSAAVTFDNGVPNLYVHSLGRSAVTKSSAYPPGANGCSGNYLVWTPPA